MSNAPDDSLPRVAVVGMSGRFPGSPDLETFWRNLRDGVECIATFAPEELELPEGETRAARDPRYVRRRGIVEDVEGFDPAFFGYSRREAELTDPQQRLFLECAWEALENAGYDPARCKQTVGVFGGVGFNHYLLNNLLSNRKVVEASGFLQTSIRNRGDHVATNVAYRLNLKGPAVTVQTACSTSLVAVHLACQSLLQHECDLAMAGGASVTVPQRSGYLAEEGGIMSPDGHCRPFDAEAQGTVSGNGAGVVVLKRLADALADRDRIYAVIRGSAIGNDGSGKVGYTAPSVEGQARVVCEAHAVSGVDPASISFLEAHGTGTRMGDPIEIAALNEAFRNAAPGACLVGSVKSNLGHLDAAAGVASLIKTVLALQHRQVPPSLHFSRANPEIPFAAGPFRVNDSLKEWQGPRPLRAGVSSFGIGGTNAHLVLEEAPPSPAGSASRPQQLLLLSAGTSSALEESTRRLAERLDQDQSLELPDVAYTLQVGRAQLPHRRMVVCRDRDEASRALRSLDPTLGRTGFHEPRQRDLVFMFPGQGAQYIGMGLDLYRHEPTFRREVEACTRQLRPILGVDLLEVIFPAAGVDEARASARLRQTELAQPALFVIEYALAALCREWGLEPSAMIGHSIGEYVAACLAGVFSLEDALRLVALRGRVVQKAPPGGMLVVPQTEAACRELAASKQLSLAAVNGPESCVLSGPLLAIEGLERELGAGGVAVRRLHTSHAFHSHMLDPILAEFGEICAGARFHAPQRPYLSNLTGTWITAAEATDPGYWVRHLRHTVRFADGLAELVRQADSVLLEVGPGRSLSTFARLHPARAAAQVVLSTLRHPSEATSDEAFLLTTLGRLWMVGGSIEWSGFHRHEARSRVTLPGYPFERQRCWVDPGSTSATDTALETLEKRPDLDQWFYVPTWQRSPLVTSRTASDRGPWLLLADAHGLADAVGAELSRRGIEVMRVDGELALHPSGPEGYERLLNGLRAEGRWPSRILHLGNVAAEGEAERETGASLLSAIYLAQALGRLPDSTTTDLVFVTNQLHDVIGNRVLGPERATLFGACQVIPQEYPTLTCRHIDLDLEVGRPWTGGRVEQLVTECEHGTQQRVALYGRHRWQPTYTSLASPSTDSFRVRPGGVYLISGGLGGIGLTLAGCLVESGPVKLVLIGRSELPSPETWQSWLDGHPEGDVTSTRIRGLRELEAKGAEVLVLSADVSDASSLSGALDRARERFGEIHGVIHAAGVAGGGMIQLKTREAIRAVLAPKVTGTRLLASLLGDTPLDFFVACSSRSAILGGFGQSDYCAANAFLDVFAASTRDSMNPILSLNWDAWKGVGMLADKAARHASLPGTTTTSDHPLLDHYSQGPDGTEVYLTRVSPRTHWVLDEHRIVGSAVMPGTAYLEMARAAVERHAGGAALEIRDAFFLAPLGLRDDEQREVRTTIKRDDPGGFSFRVSSQASEGQGEGVNGQGGREWKDYASGKIRLVPATAPRRHDLKALMRRCSDRHVVITDDSSRDEDLGPRWQALREAHVGKNEHLAILELPEMFNAELATMKLHPSLLDRATGTGKEFLIRSGIYLPMGYRRLTLHRPLTRKIFVHVRFREEVDPTGQTITFDVVFMNGEGDELVDIEAFAQKRINDVTGQVRAFANRQYGRWEDTAARRPMKKTLDRVYADQLAQGISPAEGAEAFRRLAFLKGHPQVVVSARDLHASLRLALERPSERQVAVAAAQATAPSPEAGQAVSAPPIVASVGELEQKLIEVWQRVLGVEDVGLNDNFFDLGGDSIQAIQIVSQLNEMGYGLTAQELFQHQTVAALASSLASLAGADETTELSPVLAAAARTGG